MSRLSGERLEWLRLRYAGVRNPQPPPVVKGKCRWCESDVPKGRRTWCSDECVDEWECWRSPIHAAWKNDRGICRECGVDAEMLNRVRHRIRDRTDLLPTEKSEALRELAGHFGFTSRDTSYWEADHIQEIANGGTNEPRNIRTLCQACHRKATARFRKRKSADEKATIKTSVYGALRIGDKVVVQARSLYGDRSWYDKAGRVIGVTSTKIRVKWKASAKQKRHSVRLFSRVDGKSDVTWCRLKVIE